jgi:hypothetical protein
MMRQTDIALSTLPDFDIAWKSLKKAVLLLENNNKTCRIERLPLCFMRWFEHVSTETRKIVKNEERIVHFLDFRETFQELDWEHERWSECNKCDLKWICAWLYEKEKYYNYVKLKTQKVSLNEKKKIIEKIKSEF